jgi:hypothetical protein
MVPRTESNNSKYSGATAKVAGTPQSIGATSYVAAPVKVADFTSSRLSGAMAKVEGTPQAIGTTSYAAAPAKVADSTNSRLSGATTKVEGTPQAIRTFSHAAAQVPQAGDLSITPEYATPPRRDFKMAAALQSPYVHVARKISFKCSNECLRRSLYVLRKVDEVQEQEACILCPPLVHIFYLKTNI